MHRDWLMPILVLLVCVIVDFGLRFTPNPRITVTFLDHFVQTMRTSERLACSAGDG